MEIRRGGGSDFFRFGNCVRNRRFIRVRKGKQGLNKDRRYTKTKLWGAYRWGMALEGTCCLLQIIHFRPRRG